MKTKWILLSLCILLLFSSCVERAPLVPIGTFEPTSSASLAPTDTTLPTITPTPTPTPEARIATGDQALFDGNYDRALSEYQAVLDNSQDPELIAAALWGLGLVNYAIANNGQALLTLQQLTSQYPASPNAVRAYFLMGEIYQALQRYLEAAQAFTVYLALRPGFIDAYAQELRGDAFAAAGNNAEAISAYQVALGSPHLGDDTALEIKIAQEYIKQGNNTEAIGIYDALFTTSSNDYVKAQMDLLIGQIYLSLGETDKAYQRFIHSVDNYPLAYDSYSALVALVNANIPVDDMNRGLVDYYAGQYGYAIDAFTRYIAANPDNDGTALYYSAKASDMLGDYHESVDKLTLFISNYPENQYWQTAWEDKSNIQWATLYDYELAAKTLLTFVQQLPANPSAPSYLMQAARDQERAGNLEAAAQTWDRVANEYQSSDLVPQALFWVGITRYRLGNLNAALVAFQRDSILSTNVEDKAKAHFWVGKTQQALGNTDSARASWQQTAAIDPTDYYSLRAQDLLFNRPAFDPLQVINTTVDLSAERLVAEAWLRVAFNLPADTDLSSPGALLADPRLIRGTEFMKLGLESQARMEFDALRTAVETNPADCFRLANYLLDLGLYYPAIFSIRQVLTLAGMNTQAQTLAAPAYFNHVRYGLYYQELVFPDAQQAELDPLFIFSVMRQESLFDKFAGSGQGALGLMQITPDTGQLISESLGWPPNYSSMDLFRPLVSIGLGTTFLQSQLLRFNGEFFTTLAAYNGGQNAGPIWRELSGPDPDLFVEVIRPEETRDYIRSIYEIYAMYRTLYTPSP
jgi:soluble lytic murein transglycosylase